MRELTVDDYRRILASDLSDPSWMEFKKENFKTATVFNLSRGFELAKNLLPELALITNKPRLDEINYLYYRLATSLSVFDNASFADFEYLVENASFCLFSYIIYNMSFPVALFIESERVQNYIISEEVDQHALSRWSKRRDEVVAYLRDTVADYKHMTDDMILSISGINLLS